MLIIEWCLILIRTVLLLICTFIVFSFFYHIGKKPDSSYQRFSKNNFETNHQIEPTLKLHNIDQVAIEVISSKDALRVYVNDNIAYVSPIRSVGISFVAINSNTLEIIKSAHFNTYASHSESDSLLNSVKACHKHELVILGVVDEGSTQLSDKLKLELSRQGSTMIKHLKFRSMWALIFLKDQGVLGENILHRAADQEWPAPLYVYASLTPQNKYVSIKTLHCDNWPQNSSFKRRNIFCLKYHEDFFDICDCHNYVSIDFPYQPLKSFQNHSSVNIEVDPNSVLDSTPIAIVSSSRPSYLMRCLQRLLSISGTRKNMIKIYTDSKNQMNVDIARLFEINLYYTSKKCTSSCEIANHYRSMFMDITKSYPTAPEIIIIEEDLLVSPDFFYYFVQVLPFYRKSDYYYCVSAWNDQSYNHTTGDYKMLYLTDTMPGLGFAIKRSTVVNDWLSSWPKPPVSFDWDYFVRSNKIRKDRECIVPDISRTFHFGKKGYSINPESQRVHFDTRPMVAYVETFFDLSWLKNNSYEDLIIDLIKNGVPVKSKTIDEICSIGMTAYDNYFNTKRPKFEPFSGLSIEKLRKNTRTIYLKMDVNFDQKLWKRVSNCWKIWTMDSRDFHFGALRIWFSGVHYIVVMCPISKYCEYKPNNIIPIPITMV